MVNEAAVANAIELMNTLGEDMRRAVKADMASLVGQVSGLISRASQGEDVVRQWQDAVDGLYGIGYAKKGFMGAMLGYGQNGCVINTHAVAAALLRPLSGSALEVLTTLAALAQPVKQPLAQAAQAAHTAYMSRPTGAQPRNAAC